jgi:hypothetical protein
MGYWRRIRLTGLTSPGTLRYLVQGHPLIKSLLRRDQSGTSTKKSNNSNAPLSGVRQWDIIVLL